MTHSKDNRVTGSGLHNSAAGQAMLIVIAILAILVLLPVVVVTAASQGTSTVASGQDANLYAMQAAEAGVAQFRALLSADPGLVSDYTQGHGANTKGINVTSAITSTTPNLYNYRTGNGPTETPTPKSSSLCSNNFVTMSPDKFSKSGAIRTANWVTVTNTTAPACEHFSIQVVAASTTTSTTNNNCALQNTQTPTVTIVSTGIAGMPYSSKWTEKAVSVTIDNPGYKSTTTPSCAMETNYNLTNAAHSTLNSWLGTAGSIANEAQGLLSAFGISLNSYIPMFGTISSALNSPTERAMLLNMLCDHYAGQKWTLGPINSSMWGNGPPPFCPVDPAGGGWAWTGAFPDPSALLGDLVTGNYSNIGSSVSNVFYSWRTTYNGPVYSNDPLYSCTGPEHGPAYVNFVSAALNIVQGNWGTLIIDAILGVMFTALSDMFTPEQAQFNGPVVAGVSTISGNNFKTYTPPGLGAAENAVQSVLSNYIGSTYAGDLTTVLNYALGQPTCLDATGNGNGSSYGPGQNSNGAQYNSTTNVSPTPIRLPQASSEILTLAVKGQGQAPTNAGGHPTSMYGCLYQGQTVIKFHQNGTMQVWSPDSTTTANDGTSLNTVPDGGSVSDSASSNGCPANGGIAGIPPVIYVENLNTGGTVEPPVNWTDNACDAANNPNNGKCQSEPDGDTDGGRAEPAITWTDGACDAANNPSSYKGSPTGCNKEPDGDEAAEPKTNWNDNTCDAAGNPSGKCQSAPDGDEQQIYVGEPPVNWSDNACDAAGNPGAYPFGTCGLEGAADDTGIGNSDVVDSYTWTENACDAAGNPNNGQCNTNEGPNSQDGDEHQIYVENNGVNWDDNACDASGNGNWNCGLEGAADKTNTGNSDAQEASITWNDSACDAAGSSGGPCWWNTEGPNSQDGDESYGENSSNQNDGTADWADGNDSEGCGFFGPYDCADWAGEDPDASNEPGPDGGYSENAPINWNDNTCDASGNGNWNCGLEGVADGSGIDNSDVVDSYTWNDNACDAAGNPNNGQCNTNEGPNSQDGDEHSTYVDELAITWTDGACDVANNPSSYKGSSTGCQSEPDSDNAEPVHQWSDNTCDAAGNPNNGTCKPDPGDGDSVVTPPVNWDDNACDAANNPTSSNGSPTGCNTNEPGSDGVPSSGGSCMPFPNPPFTNLNYGLGTSQNNPIQGQNCANGNAIVQGNLSGKLTIEAQNDVIITNSIYYYGPNCPGQSTAAPSSTCTNFTDLGLVAQGNVDVNHPLNSGVQELNTILSDISTVCSVFGDITGVITDIVNVFGGNGGSNSTLSGLGNLFNLCGSVTNAIQMVVTYEVGMINNDCVGNPSWYSSSGNLINSSAAYNPCSALPAPPYGSTANDSDDTTRPQSQTPFPDPSEPTYIQIDFPDMIRDIGDSVADIVADTASICQGEDCTVSYNWNDGTQPDSGDGDAPGNSDCEATLDSCWGDPAEDGLQIIADAGVDAAGDLLCGDSNPEGSCTQTVPGTDWLSDGGGKNGSLESDNPNCNAGGFSNCLSDGDGDGITLPNPANMQGAFDIFTDWINSNNPVTIAGFTLFTGLDWLMDYLSPDTNFPAFYGMGSHGGQPAVINAAIVAVGPNTGDGSNGTQSIVPMMGPLNCPKWNINCGEFKVNNSSSGYTMGTLHVNGSVTEYYRGKTESYCSSLGNLMSNISSPAPFLNCVMISGYALDLTYAPITSPFLFTTHNYQVTNSFVTQAKTSTPSVNSRVTLPMQIVSPATTTTTHHSPPPTTTHHSPTTTTHHCAIVNGHPICCIGPRCYP